MKGGGQPLTETGPQPDGGGEAQLPALGLDPPAVRAAWEVALLRCSSWALLGLCMGPTIAKPSSSFSHGLRHVIIHCVVNSVEL